MKFEFFPKPQSYGDASSQTPMKLILQLLWMQDSRMLILVIIPQLNNTIQENAINRSDGKGGARTPPLVPQGSQAS